MNPGLAERLHARALVLDGQRQPAENIVELARNLRFPLAPTSRSGKWFDFMPALGVRGIDDHCKPVSALVDQLLGDQLLQHSRKESLLQIASIKGDPAQNNPIVRELR